MTFKVTEIYASIQGESSYAGFPCTFVRLTGCPLRCRWCDTVYGFEGGRTMTLDDIVAEVTRLGIPLVELTGGEPLAQPRCVEIMDELQSRGFKILLETSGSEDIAPVPSHVHIIMDLKCPGSGMSDRNLWTNLDSLKATDEIKLVVANRDDFEWAKSVVVEKDLAARFKVLFSCAFGLVKPHELAQWMLETPHLATCRFQLQQHKYIWSPRAKGV